MNWSWSGFFSLLQSWAALSSPLTEWSVVQLCTGMSAVQSGAHTARSRVGTASPTAEEPSAAEVSNVLLSEVEHSAVPQR